MYISKYAYVFNNGYKIDFIFILYIPQCNWIIIVELIVFLQKSYNGIKNLIL